MASCNIYFQQSRTPIHFIVTIHVTHKKIVNLQFCKKNYRLTYLPTESKFARHMCENHCGGNWRQRRAVHAGESSAVFASSRLQCSLHTSAHQEQGNPRKRKSKPQKNPVFITFVPRSFCFSALSSCFFSSSVFAFYCLASCAGELLEN